jgi:hypothetical protein
MSYYFSVATNGGNTSYETYKEAKNVFDSLPETQSRTLLEATVKTYHGHEMEVLEIHARPYNKENWYNMKMIDGKPVYSLGVK